MADANQQPNDANQAGDDEQQFFVQKIYLKDVSFESPQSPEIFASEDWDPEVNVQVANNATRVGEGVFETALTITVTATAKDSTIYLAEVQYAGIFTIVGFDQASEQQLLGSYCPNLLFPFIRETVSDLVTKGGFPQMVLQPINFDALFQQHQQDQAAVGAERPQ